MSKDLALDDTLLGHLLTEAGFTYQTATTCPGLSIRAYNTSAEMQQTNVPRDETGMALYSATPGTHTAGFTPFRAADISPNTPTYLLHAKGPITVDNTDYDHLVVVAGDCKAMKHATKHWECAVGFTLTYPSSMWASNNVTGVVDFSLSIVSMEEPCYYPVPLQSLKQLWADRTIRQDRKIISTLRIVFPHMEEWLTKSFTELELPQSWAAGTSRAATTDEEGKILTALAILGPSFSRKSKIGPQLTRRISAACAFANLQAPVESAVTNTIRVVAWQNENVSSIISLCIGHMVAVDQDYNYDPLVSIDQLPTLDALKKDWACNPYSLGLMKQARLVYTNFQASSLCFAYAIKDELKALLTPLGDIWKTQIDRVIANAEKLEGRPYIGCVESIPKDQQVGQQARPVYIGLLYHEANLGTQEEKEEFKEYAIRKICNHISPATDQQLCKYIATILPPLSVKALGRMASVISAAQVDTVCANAGPEFTDRLYQHLKYSQSTCEWYLTKKLQKEKETARISKEILRVSSDKLKQTIDSIHREAAMTQDPVRKTSRYDYATWLQAEYEDRQNAMVPFESRIAEASHSSLEEVRMKIINELKPLYDLASRLNPPTAPSPAQPPTTSA